MPARSDKQVEVYMPGEPLPVRDPWIDKLAWLMDGSIPIGRRWSIGLDAVVGLIPGFGDMVGALVSMLIVLRAVQAGIPRVAVARMMANIAIDSLLGAIPIAGDVFDLAFKSNQRNLRIYEQAVRGERSAAVRHWGFFAALFLGVAGIAMGAALTVIAIARAL
jgi:hypothetical protein